MTTTLALVVDDSRMARHMLSKMLKEQGIDVDTVESGEEALGYLCGKKPSMIFMDHTMPGMDGFQTLRAIKNDPLTAAIPIIMYTSKEGEVYESQARALGAVGVIPKTLKPLELAKVLENQKLLPGQLSTPPVKPTEMDRPAANDVVIVESEPPLQEEPPVTIPSKTTAHNTELLELEQRLQQLTQQLQDLNGRPIERRAVNRSYRLQYFGLALCVVLIGLLLMYNAQINRQINEIRLENANLRQSLQEKSSTPNRVSSQPATPSTPPPSPATRVNRRYYENMEWALNQEGQFPFGEKPFNEKLVGTLTRLAESLHSEGFHGEILVRSHLGRFCTQTSDTGESVLPEKGQPMSSCEVLEYDPATAETIGIEQTPAFSAFVTAFDSEFGDSIRLTLSTAADRRPLVRYPLPDPDMDAARWNALAARNQRIEISINPQ